MFLKSLQIINIKYSSVIREITFRNGINLIVDESEESITGNNIGKTTVLKLIDFCFGANKNNVWQDPENPKEVYNLVKDFLIDNEVLVVLTLSESLTSKEENDVVIERNFLSSRKTVIRRINRQQYTDEEFEDVLKELFFPNLVAEKPSFRQIISHNIRYKDLSINNTLKTLDKFTSDAEYETLYLYLLGCEFNEGNQKQEILQQIRQEDNFKKRLEKFQTKSAYETTLSLIENDIEELNVKKSNLNLNENFDSDLNKLNQIKYEINKLSSEISKINIRKELIIEAKNDLEANKSEIDLPQLEQIYNQATDILGELQKSFENMVNYHNQMITEKAKFINNELPNLEQKLEQKNKELDRLLSQESELSKIIAKSDSFEELELLISELTEKYRIKGEYENTIQQLQEVEDNLNSFNNELKEIDEALFSDEFEEKVKTQLNKFNKYFSSVSEYLYDEKYALKYEKITNRKGQRLYKFSAFNTNFSSGKKQGEISCFDIAYILFARNEEMPSMDFLLNDKKELMHDNQLVKIAQFVNENDIQFVASILKDKLPVELNHSDNFILELSEDNKLFRIENN
ncbi:DUF2326 domain-containing protein [Galbibacter sp. EGI 63066]|uniref:DUF2326 domain-containing protein n=1 Tax=Galbibacter sp. EGI 63066 TaxID=2993559 RepID=UPI0022489521|nr:DUF2326 domain-containing protein [Galbibacter sp. EGI 63066]MCX2679577.1 DUF2326 domain-containing protein [Galbibacter sp. EGI 63066]